MSQKNPFQSLLNNDLSDLREIITSGFNVNKPKGENTLLDLAITSGNLEAVKLLVELGADVNKPSLVDREYRFPLKEAFEADQREIANYLIEHSASLKTKDYGRRVLELAIAARWPDTVELLISKGADVNEKNRYGETVLGQAVFTLMRDEDYGIGEDILAALLRAGANVNQPLNDMTPLAMAIEFNHLPIIKQLLAAKANVNTEREGKPSFLHRALENPELVKILLAAGANLEHKSYKGYTPILTAANIGAEDSFTILLEAGANLTALNSANENAAICAAEGHNMGILKKVIERGIDVNKPDRTGATPLLIILMDHSQIDKSTLLPMVNLLLDAGANPNVVYEGGGSTTALSYALDEGVEDSLALVKTLLAHGANVNLKTEVFVPILYAAQRGLVDVVKLMIESGADVTAELKGKSALDYADAGHFSPELTEVIKKAAFVPWKGFTKSDIQRLNVIFETDVGEGGRPNAENWSMCPICLKYVERSAACKYMSHNCATEGGFYHKRLYNTFRNEAGIVYWCTVCNRICSGHRHYELRRFDERQKLVGLQEGVDFFAGDCRGLEGGGGLPEKLLRFRRFKAVAAELQAEIDTMSFKQAMEYLAEEMWNAPFSRMTERARESMLTAKAFNTSNNVFFENRPAAAEEAPNVIRPPENRVVVTQGGFNTISGVDAEEDVLFFIHKQLDGSMKDHQATNEGIAVSSLESFLEGKVEDTTDPTFGFCPFYYMGCRALLYPEDIQLHVSEELSTKYKDRFKNKYADRKREGMAGYVGGRLARLTRRIRRNRHTQRGGEGPNVLQEASQIECVVPPKKGGFRTRRKGKGRKRNTRRS